MAEDRAQTDRQTKGEGAERGREIHTRTQRQREMHISTQNTHIRTQNTHTHTHCAIA